MSIEVLNSVWYTTCDGETIGIVKTKDTITGEIKYRIGTGLGFNEQDDIQKIVSMGSRFYPEYVK